jgi:hypothetical protein
MFCAEGSSHIPIRSSFRVDGDSCFGMLAKRDDDPSRDGLLQEDGRRLR